MREVELTIPADIMLSSGGWQKCRMSKDYAELRDAFVNSSAVLQRPVTLRAYEGAELGLPESYSYADLRTVMNVLGIRTVPFDVALVMSKPFFMQLKRERVPLYMNPVRDGARQYTLALVVSHHRLYLQPHDVTTRDMQRSLLTIIGIPPEK